MSVNFVLHCSGRTSFTTKYIWLHRTNLCCRLSSVAEDTIRAYFESRLVLLEPVFPLACHRLCEGPDFSMDFTFKSQPQPEGNPKFLHIFTLPDMQKHHLTREVVYLLFFCCQTDSWILFLSCLAMLGKDATLLVALCYWYIFYRLHKRRITLQTSDTEYWWKGWTLLTLEFLIDSYYVRFNIPLRWFVLNILLIWSLSKNINLKAKNL